MKGMIFVLDGLSDRPLKELDGKTPLEYANTPNMDLIAKKGINGIMDTIKPGVVPGSDTAHLALLGYDPYEVYTGRGPFEAAGVGVEVKPGDIAFRCNFSTLQDGKIIDRRAGRIREGNEQLIEAVNQMTIPGYEDIEIIFKESTGHRAVLVLRGENLSDQITDADPKHEGNPVPTVQALNNTSEAVRTADLLNKIVETTYQILKNHPINQERIQEGKMPGNIILPRGVGAVPHVEPFNTRYNLKSACIAETGLIMGIGEVAKMDVKIVEGVTGGLDTNFDNIFNCILENLEKDYNFYLINIKGADEMGHDSNMEDKIKFMEKVDTYMGKLLEIEDTYILLTADHSTPISKGNHSADPVPVSLIGPEVRVDDVEEYNEKACAKGGLCRIQGQDIVPILLDLMNNTKKFGA